MPDYLEDLGSVVLALFALIGVLVLAYFTTKWLARRTGGDRGKGIIKIIDRQFIAQDKSFIVLRVGKKILLVGHTSQSMTKLADLDEDDIVVEETAQVKDFSAVLLNAIKKLGGEKDRGSSNPHDKDDTEGSGGNL
ncbi:MAG: flagellar biosynthetic protein FliO [Clostridiales bacterium]|nr:flagellar biosynthetic protein FliO [Clostridiales bacterium]